MPLDHAAMSLDVVGVFLVVADVFLELAAMNVSAAVESSPLHTKSLDEATMPIDHEAKEVKTLDGSADDSTKNRDLEHESLDDEKKTLVTLRNGHEPALGAGEGARRARGAL